jgi:hypothetical protein
MVNVTTFPKFWEITENGLKLATAATSATAASVTA